MSSKAILNLLNNDEDDTPVVITRRTIAPPPDSMTAREKEFYWIEREYERKFEFYQPKKNVPTNVQNQAVSQNSNPPNQTSSPSTKPGK